MNIIVALKKNISKPNMDWIIYLHVDGSFNALFIVTTRSLVVQVVSRRRSFFSFGIGCGFAVIF